MTREQFVVVIFGFLVVAAVAVWLMWHLIWRPVWEERQRRLAAERNAARFTAATGIPVVLDERMPENEIAFVSGGKVQGHVVNLGAREPFSAWPNYSAPPLDWKRDRLL